MKLNSFGGKMMLVMEVVILDNSITSGDSAISLAYLKPRKELIVETTTSVHLLALGR